MSKYGIRQKLLDNFTLRSAAYIGMWLLIAVCALTGHAELKQTRYAAENAMSIMKQQCISFDKLTAADRTKSLFRLSDLMRDLSSHLAHEPELINDEYLEQYVDSLRLSGVAVLNEDLMLEASGYTRRFRDAGWINTADGSRFADIVRHPAKVYLERIERDGEYYDICAAARKDAPGIIIGFYCQPSGLITDTENDLESMLTGLHLERSGHYIIAENGELRAASDAAQAEALTAGNGILQKMSRIPKDDRLHLFTSGGRYYWGYRSGCESYSLYIYYPLTSMISAWILSAAVFTALYSIVIMLFVLFNNRSLREKQEELRRSNHSLTQTVEMLKSLETIYFTLFYVDLKEDSYKSVYTAPWLSSIIPDKGSYTELKKQFVDSMVVDEFRDNVDLRMSYDFIRDNLNRRVISEVRRSFYTDYKAIRGGLIRWCRVTAAAVDYDDEGNPYHVMALIQDIDDEKKKEADYEEQIRREAHQAKVANNAKTEFLRRISHDIRTPLNAIQGYMALGADHPEDVALQSHCRDKASTALHTLLELVNSVLDMSKLESEDVIYEDKAFDLAELLAGINTIISPQAEAKNIRYEIPGTEDIEIRHLIGSPKLLGQIIMNLCSNAVKYTEPGGFVRVCVNTEPCADDTVSCRFTVEDNGIGMSEEFQQHMFEPFAQENAGARTKYEGVGLGLSIVKKLTDALGGTVSCKSEKNKGTIFDIDLKFRINDEFDSQPDITDNSKNAMLRNKRILLVEDNELNMEIAEFIFTEQGAVITKAWNGKEAVDIFAASEPGSFDIILMDIMMPEMDGLEAARKIRKLVREDVHRLPILAMSANSFPDDVQRSLDAGMNGHIAKPIDMSKLWNTLAEYL